MRSPLLTPLSKVSPEFVAYKICMVSTDFVFFKAGNKWNLTEEKGMIMGYVIHKGELEIEKLL
ncbi:hypothetical protein S225a_02330 [Candidatus Brocadiaceae bacterium S225]|nr:hypothetical protein S225a_02330 [Candidatus Brocadiaceae bacterium S225]